MGVTIAGDFDWRSQESEQAGGTRCLGRYVSNGGGGACLPGYLAALSGSAFGCRSHRHGGDPGRFSGRIGPRLFPLRATECPAAKPPVGLRGAGRGNWGVGSLLSVALRVGFPFYREVEFSTAVSARWAGGVLRLDPARPSYSLYGGHCTAAHAGSVSEPQGGDEGPRVGLRCQYRRRLCGHAAGRIFPLAQPGTGRIGIPGGGAQPGHRRPVLFLVWPHRPTPRGPHRSRPEGERERPVSRAGGGFGRCHRRSGEGIAEKKRVTVFPSSGDRIRQRVLRNGNGKCPHTFHQHYFGKFIVFIKEERKVSLCVGDPSSWLSSYSP